MAESKKKIYFASDVHLGAPYIKNPKEHEARFVRWLDLVKADAEAIYLLGDIFDFWFEYKKVVPKGFVRTLAKIAEITDSGIPVHFFIGNHDIWIWDYLPSETGVILHKKPLEIELQGKKFFMAHGDGLGDPDKVFKYIRKFFHSKLAQWLYSNFIHPDLGMAFGQRWSGHSREGHDVKHISRFLGEDKEHLVLFAKEMLKTKHFDYFVFGHRHIVLNLMLQKDSTVVNLGDWIGHFSYGVLEGGQMHIEFFEADETIAAD